MFPSILHLLFPVSLPFRLRDNPSQPTLTVAEEEGNFTSHNVEEDWLGMTVMTNARRHHGDLFTSLTNHR